MRIPVRIGYSTKNQICGTVEHVKCPKCGQMVTFIKMKNVTTGTIMFIPVVKATNSTYVLCTSCQSTFAVKKKDFSYIDTNENVLKAIVDFSTEQIEHNKRQAEKYSVGFSTKNQTLAVIFACLFTSLGIPFFYIGKPLYGLVCLIISILGCIFRIFPLMFAIVYVGFIYAILLGLGKIKDGSGKYIASKRQQLLFQKKE